MSQYQRPVGAPKAGSSHDGHELWQLEERDAGGPRSRRSESSPPWRIPSAAPRGRDPARRALPRGTRGLRGQYPGAHYHAEQLTVAAMRTTGARGTRAAPRRTAVLRCLPAHSSGPRTAPAGRRAALCSEVDDVRRRRHGEPVTPVLLGHREVLAKRSHRTHGVRDHPVARVAELMRRRHGSRLNRATAVLKVSSIPSRRLNGASSRP